VILLISASKVSHPHSVYSEHWCISFSVDISIHFSWVDYLHFFVVCISRGLTIVPFIHLLSFLSFLGTSFLFWRPPSFLSHLIVKYVLNLPWATLFFQQHWHLNSGPIPLATPRALFLCICVRYFQDRILQTIPGWLRTTIRLIATSWVARIISVSHRCLACCFVFVLRLSYYVAQAGLELIVLLPQSAKY
jgi:hypothetical protein